MVQTLFLNLKSKLVNSEHWFIIDVGFSTGENNILKEPENRIHVISVLICETKHIFNTGEIHNQHWRWTRVHLQILPLRFYDFKNHSSKIKLTFLLSNPPFIKIQTWTDMSMYNINILLGSKQLVHTAAHHPQTTCWAVHQQLSPSLLFISF